MNPNSQPDPQQLSLLLGQLTDEARSRNWSDRRWANEASVPAETLSRLKKRPTCDLETLGRLAAPLRMKVGLFNSLPEEIPKKFGREEEEHLLDLCSRDELDLKAWAESGPRFFMAGLATMLAGVREGDRTLLLMMADALHPAMSTVEMYSAWLKKTPVRPSRFLPMLRKRLELRRAGGSNLLTLGGLR